MTGLTSRQANAIGQHEHLSRQVLDEALGSSVSGLTLVLPCGPDPVIAARIVRIDDDGTVAHAGGPDQNVVGVALNGADPGEDVVILYVGVAEHLVLAEEQSLTIGRLVEPESGGTITQANTETARIGMTLSAGSGLFFARADIAFIEGAVLTFTANDDTEAGELITVAALDPGAPDVTLAVDVTGTDIVITLGTDSGGEIITTVAELYTALLIDQPTQALVRVDASGEIDTLTNASPQQSLTGFALPDPLDGVTVLVSLPQMYSD